MTSKYHLLNTDYREQVDLTMYEKQLKKAIYTVIDKSIGVTVYSKYYEIDTDITSGEARIIGTRISKYCSGLRELRETCYYSGNRVSRRIFIRME